MNEQFIPYELALELKELGFNEECLGRYTKGWTGDMELTFYIGQFKYEPKDYRTNCNAPLWQQAFDWFRINHNLFSLIEPYPTSKEPNRCYYKIIGQKVHSEENGNTLMSGWFSSYEEAKLKALEKLISLVKESK